MNLSVALVEEGLASVHFSAEKTEYFRELKTAEDGAKKLRKRIWANYVEEVIEKAPEESKEDTVTERKVAYEKVVVTEIIPLVKDSAGIRFFAQHAENGAKLEGLMAKLRQDFQANPPITGAYTPARGDLVAAQFSEDNEWYRAKVIGVNKGSANVLYIDYGNKEVSHLQIVIACCSFASSLDPFRAKKK